MRVVFSRLKPARVFWLILCLVVSLLLAQTLGVLHGIVHSPLTLHPAALEHQLDEDTPSLLARLFSGHQDGDADCHTYDQLSHVDAVPGVPVLALPLVLLPFVLALLPGLATARWHALFEARGPPASR